MATFIRLPSANIAPITLKPPTSPACVRCSVSLLKKLKVRLKKLWFYRLMTTSSNPRKPLTSSTHVARLVLPNVRLCLAKCETYHAGLLKPILPNAKIWVCPGCFPISPPWNLNPPHCPCLKQNLQTFCSRLAPRNCPWQI